MFAEIAVALIAAAAACLALVLGDLLGMLPNRVRAPGGAQRTFRTRTAIPDPYRNRRQH
jgi:hypothetical protein